jgi:UDP-N-acetylglucosamine 2-epimerase (non-hydrolysing)
MHRPENVDDPVRLERWLAALAAASLPVLLPLHPRTRARLGADPGGAVQLLEPLHHGEFLALLAGCAVAVSDSGGIQEEVSVLGRRVLVARRSTERPEGLGTFAHLVTDPDDLVGLLHDELVNPAAAHARLAAVASPYGDGHAGERIAEAVLSRWG